MRSFTLTASALLFSLISATQGAALDSWSPTILTPTAGTTWVIGETVTVTWDTMSKPGSITNPKGKIWLKRGDYTITSPDESLAGPFLLADGHVDLVVPDVEPHNDYQVVLYGNSGNWSGNITISK